MIRFFPSEDCLKRTFRSNPNYTVVICDRLSNSIKESLGKLVEESDCFGILQPSDSSTLSIKTICRETALLFYILKVPGQLPNYLLSEPSINPERLISQLILDDILEGEIEGNFTSGLQAYQLLFSKSGALTTSEKPEYNTEGISYEALVYGQEFINEDISKLGRRLYFYNRRPSTKKWLKQLKSSNDVNSFLGLLPEQPNHKLVHRYWYESTQNSNKYWVFRRSKKDDFFEENSSLDGYKLYFNPTCEYLYQTLSELTEILFHCRAYAFKYGGNAYGMLRPDKFVAYFQTKDDLFLALEKLQKRFYGVPAQELPFTATVDPTGLLSWGIDPPNSSRTSLLWHSCSWRSWVTERLSAALIKWHHQPDPKVEPWQFALAHVSLDGINITTWIPEQTIWN